MAAPSKTWVTIADSQVDADSPLDATLMTGMRDDLIHLREWLGLNYTAAQDHDHDGVNSKLMATIPDGIITPVKMTPYAGVAIFDDFLTTTILNQWATSGASVPANGDNGQLVLQPFAGAYIWAGAACPFRFGTLTFATAIKMDVSNDATGTFRCGLGVSSGLPDNSDRVCFQAGNGAAQSNWVAVTRNSGGTTTTALGVNPSTSTFQKLRIEGTPSSVKFYIDDVLKATHTTNISTLNMSPVIVAGNRTPLCDYIYALNAARL